MIWHRSVFRACHAWHLAWMRVGACGSGCAGSGADPVSGERNAAFTQAADIFTKELERAGVSLGDVQYLTLAEARTSAAKAGQLVLALGVSCNGNGSQ